MLMPPVEVAARIARADALRDNPHLKPEDIGVFFISPCPAKVSYVKNPDCVKKSAVDATLAISNIYFRLISEMKQIKKPPPISASGVIGISWAASGGESAALFNEKYLAADGIENVINVLDKIENENFAGLDFIELNACSGGCVGGTLTVENAYIAKARIQKLRKYLPVSQNTSDKDKEDVLKKYAWENGLEYNPVMKLDGDKAVAVKMMMEMQKICERLPALDCGACGAPSCKAFAEDIVRGLATEDDCLIRLREKYNMEMSDM
jgi:iron only hydrogenase large subunit-like protein